MTITPWSANVNQRFFEVKAQPKENAVTVEMAGGRVVSWQRNTRAAFAFSAKIRLKKSGELDYFWNWFNFALGGIAGAFSCAALTAEFGSLYFKFREVPSVENSGGAYRVLSLSFEEVY